MADININSLIAPSMRIGHDGFHWWVGQIEGISALEKNNKGGYRYKVAIVGEHPKSREIVSTADLPWANVMMPVNQPFSPGNITGAAAQLTPGCWVVGFYLDTDRQKPIIMGSIGQTPGATVEKNTIQQDDPDSRFATGDRTAPFEVDPKTDGDPGKSDKSKQNGGPPDGTVFEKKDGTTEERVDSGNMKDNLKDEEWCQETGEVCEKDDLKGQMTSVMGNFLADIQASDGNIGNYYVSKYTGGLYNSSGTARQYVNKAIRVVQEFLARLKGYVISLLQKGVNKLVKAILRPDEKGNALTPVTEWFNKLLKDLGCKMEDLGLQLAEWLTNLLMNYVNQIYRAAACQLDELVNGIISKIYQLMNQLLESILGPLQDILGAIAAPLNMIGNAINYILNLLGISCTGVDTSCASNSKVCTDGAKAGDDKDDFLDKLLESIDNLFGDTPADYTQYVCDEAYTGKPLEITTVGFAGGVPKTGTDTSAPKIVYDIDDIEVNEGDLAVFTVTRSGSTNIASSVTIKTLGNQGSATAGKDYLEVDDILGFTPGETQKTIEVQTLVDNETDNNESLFIKMTNNSPESGKYEIKFKKNIGKCTIIEKDLKEPYDPYSPTDVDPFEPIEIPDPDGTPTGETPSDDGTPTYQVTANRTTCPEDEFIIYTIVTTNITNGTILYYTLSGEGITNGDIVGQKLTGEFVVQDNQALVTVGIREDSTIEDEETLRFTINGTGAFVDVLITAPDDQTVGDNDIGVGDDLSTVFQEFRLPVVNSGNIITDGAGGIIEIPVDNTGDAFAEPPVVFVSGEGVGATATALLDDNGFVTEIRIQSSGFGYKKNLAVDKNVRCIIDAFTILSPGIGYQSAPEMYVDGELGVAEAVINEDGFVIGARVLNRTINFERLPKIELVGGGGYGARLLPSLSCLDTAALTEVGATKIGTGKYIDCP